MQGLVIIDLSKQMKAREYEEITDKEFYFIATAAAGGTAMKPFK